MPDIKIAPATYELFDRSSTMKLPLPVTFSLLEAVVEEAEEEE